MKENSLNSHLLMSVETGSSLPELNEEIMIQYLLEELPPAWQDHFEEQFFTDKKSFEQLKLVEDQLVDDYVSEVLPAEQHARFESHYLTSERRHQKLKFAQTLVKTLAELKLDTAEEIRPSLWERLGTAWKLPALRYSFAAFAVIAIVAGGWLFRESQQEPIQEQQLETKRASSATAPTLAEVPLATVTPSIVQPIPSPSALSVPKPKQNGVQPDAILSLVLSSSSLRDADATAKTLAVTPNAKEVHLKLTLNGQEPDAVYRSVLETASGKIITTQPGLRRTKVGKEYFIVLKVPAQKLPANDYLLTLSKKSDDKYEEVEDYQFRIVKRP